MERHTTNRLVEWTTKQQSVRLTPGPQTAALSRHQEEQETDNTKQAQIEQKYENH